ncbi:MAG: hypothetical protein K5990_01985 [Oscillospiraceae bacterium]|nr:hypothetical protein [Oscillospiraceae bacterium]
MKNKARRQVFSLILSLCMALALLPAAAPAQATDDPPVVGSIVKYVGIENFYEDYADVIAAVAEGLERMDETIDLSAFNITSTETSELNTISGALYGAAQSTHPEYFWTDKQSQSGFSSTDSVNWYLSYIKPTYKNYTAEDFARYGVEDLDEMKAAFAAETEYYLNLVQDKADAYDSSFDKVLLLHDELVLDAQYVLENDNYAFMVNKQGLCENYSRIYAYLLSLLGFSCELVDSFTHEWIKVDLEGDGRYYNIDLTFDDPMPNQPGRVQHTYFLLSDAAIMQETSDHGAFSCIHVSDNYYDDNVIHACTSRFCKKSTGTELVGFTDEGMMDFDYYGETGSALPVDSMNPMYFDNNTWQWPARDESGTEVGYWPGIYSGLDSYDGYYYLNLAREIWKVDIEDYHTERVYSYSDYDLPEDQYFYGLRIRGNTLYANVAPDPNTAGEEYAITELQARPTVQVFGHSLALDGRIGVNTYLLLGEIISSAPDSYQVEFYEGETLVSATKVSEVESVEKDLDEVEYTVYPFSFTAASNQMDTVFTMKLRDVYSDSLIPFVNTDGSLVDAETGLDYSVQAYLDEAAVSGSDALKPLASAMYDYGVFAKHYFRELNEGSTEDLPVIEGFEPVTAEDLSMYADQIQIPADIDGISYQGTSLLLEDDTALRMYFQSDNVDSLTIVYDGDPLEIVPGQGMYYVQISDIGAPQLNETFLFIISNGSDEITAELGPMGYALHALSGEGVRESLQYLMMALYHYSQTAYDYFSD